MDRFAGTTLNQDRRDERVLRAAEPFDDAVAEISQRRMSAMLAISNAVRAMCAGIEADLALVDTDAEAPTEDQIAEFMDETRDRLYELTAATMSRLDADAEAAVEGVS